MLKDGVIDRIALGRQVFADPVALKRLEGILHPLVRAAERRFIARARRQRRKLVVLDIPLLFETGGQARCDKVLVVSAPNSLFTKRFPTGSYVKVVSNEWVTREDDLCSRTS